MKYVYTCMALIFFFSCDEKKSTISSISEPSTIKEKLELVIVFDRSGRGTILKSFRNDISKDFYFVRENFDLPFNDLNLNIKVFHGLDHEKKIIRRKELDDMEVWFDSEMGYLDWFHLNFEKYYIIYQDEYLVKESLNPNFEFTAYEVKISTGGIE